MFTLNDPRPPTPGPDQLDEVRRRGRRMVAKRRAARAAAGSVAALLVAGALAVAADRSRSDGRQELRTAAGSPAAPAATLAPAPPSTAAASLPAPTTTTAAPPATTAVAPPRPAATSPTSSPEIAPPPGSVPCYDSSAVKAFSASGPANGFGFNYPSCWSAKTSTEAGSFSEPIVDLSDAPMGDRCTTVTDSNGTTTTCSAFPLKSLPAGDTVVMWDSVSSPSTAGTGGLAGFPGAPTTIGGHPAREQISTPGDCSQIGAAESVDVSIQATSSSSGPFYTMEACLSASGRAAQENQVRQMLATVHLPS